MDLTLLYYSACVVEEPFGTNVRNHLLSLFSDNLPPLISITHKPLDFGHNIHVDGWEVSGYNIYRQILIGAKEAKTKYVACCEDDSLYNLEHFNRRPPDDETFIYNNHRWNVNRETYFHRNRLGMLTCIVSRELMIKTLEVRFEKYNVPIIMSGWGEPGRYETRIGLPFVKMATVNTVDPILTFNHRTSIGGKRKYLRNDTYTKELPTWGKSEDLWDKMYGIK